MAGRRRRRRPRRAGPSPEIGRRLAGIGGSLAWWALTGEGDLSQPRRWVGEIVERAGWRRDDLVHDASADSFPASDAPAWTPTVGTGLRGRPQGR
jgi:hypothetical protein